MEFLVGTLVVIMVFIWAIYLMHHVSKKEHDHWPFHHA